MHLLSAVQHGIVHIDVDDGSPAFYLLSGYRHGFVIAFPGNETGKLTRTGDVGTFADVDEVAVTVDDEGFQS